jgi:NodT family efflux transporter outer membrane factor (OMF) lipoprotein
VDQHFGEFQVGFDAVWELDFWGKYRRGVKAADAEYLATVADYDDALVSMTAEVARTYVLVRTYETLIEQARRNVALQEEGQRIAQARLDNGATSELDVAQATNLLETTRASIPKLQVNLQQSENALSTLLGQPTGFVRSLILNPRGIPALPAQVQVSVPAQLLRRRPDIRAAELRALAQCQRIGVAKADLYPSFVLSGAIGTSTRVGPNSAVPLFDPSTLFASLGASVFWPILNYPKIQANIRIEDALYQQSLVGYVSTVLRAAQEVDDGVTGFLREQDAAVFFENAVVAADNAVGLALVQYREGAVDYQRVLDTQRVLLSSQNDLVNTRSAAATNLIALYKALGGGWELRVGSPVIDEGTKKEMEERSK